MCSGRAPAHGEELELGGQRGQRGGARIIPLGKRGVIGFTLTLCVFKRYL